MDIASAPVTSLAGVGPRLAQKLARLGLTTVQDVLLHLPYRYQDRTHITPIGGLQPGSEALVVGSIELADVAYRGRRSLVCRLSDGSGFVSLRFFHFSSAQRANLQRGRRLRVFGEVRAGPGGLEMVHPEYGVLRDGETFAPEPCLTPLYPSTEGLHQVTLRRVVQEALECHLARIQEWLPPEILRELDLPTIAEALEHRHRPPTPAEAKRISDSRDRDRERLAFEELLAHHLSLRRLRARQQSYPAPVLGSHGTLLAALLAQLPFALTGAQQRVIAEIRRDLQRAVPMQRLLQGDVGSGKTLVAAAAVTCAIEAGYQAAIMAPTEILAEQHARNLENWLAPVGVEVVSLLGKLGAKARQEALAAIASERPLVAVGTHALFQEAVEFGDLGLIIVDEQHRFGVHQRLALRAKGTRGSRRPHQLIMTATPIPRTLAQTLYADLDVSVINELPPGRRPVQTVVVSGTRRAEVIERIRRACGQGRQAYWVCPLIDESERLQLRTATDTEAQLRATLPGLRVSLVHGRMRASARAKTMEAFKAGDIDLLVATTVIEVGVDVARASLMIIENAERLGLSQLHQLRGRVGRGATRSICVLLYQPPLSAQARSRLATLRRTTDGFEIARRDLELRGPGELLGTRQTGIEQLRIADLLRDHHLLGPVQRVADALLAHYPDRVDTLISRWLRSGGDYAQV
jgi:ATP-dependent DNA helicase RecG